MIAVQSSPELSERLVRASTTKRCYPWDARVIDWSVPLSDDYLYVPERYSIFFANPRVWDRLDLAGRSFVTRWELTQFMRNAGTGEHLLNQAILALLHHTNQYDPAWRYMLHEVAEECQHMGMFNCWVRLNGDIQTKGLGDDGWGLWASVLTPVVATRFPVLFWTLTMLFEVTGDDLAHAQAKNEAGNLHPIVQQLGRAHAIEELRHITFARDWVRRALPRINKTARMLLNETTERILDQVLKLGINLPYSRQLEPYCSYDEFKFAIKTPHRRAMFCRQIRPTVDDFVELGVVRRRAVRRWEKSGLLLAPRMLH
jgi:P-aminobenzoate N-oxygenase AurF